MLALVCTPPRCGHVVLLSEHPTTTTASIKIIIYTLKIKFKLYILYGNTRSRAVSHLVLLPGHRWRPHLTSRVNYPHKVVVAGPSNICCFIVDTACFSISDIIFIQTLVI